jgi:hypothetical protein
MEITMRRSILLLAIVGMLVAALAIPALAGEHRDTGRGTGPTVFVPTDEAHPEIGVFYDSIVVVAPGTLSWNGQDNWQLLTMDSPHPNGLQTEFAPGSEDYFGGRWYFEVDGITGPSAGDTFFICPLLGPGTPSA